MIILHDDSREQLISGPHHCYLLHIHVFVRGQEITYFITLQKNKNKTVTEDINICAQVRHLL